VLGSLWTRHTALIAFNTGAVFPQSRLGFSGSNVSLNDLDFFVFPQTIGKPEGANQLSIRSFTKI
jgi:hypothetical protein